MYERNAGLYRRLQISGLAAPLLVAVLTLVSFYGMLLVSDSLEMVRHSNQVLSTARSTEENLRRLELSLRMYLANRQNADMQRYLSSEREFEVHLDELKEMIRDNPTQVDRLSAIEARTRVWMNGANKQMLLPTEDVIMQVDVLYNSGQQFVRDTAFAFDNFVNAEFALHSERIAKSSLLQNFLILTLILLSGTTLMVLLYLYRRSLGLFQTSLESQSELSMALQAGHMATWSMDPEDRSFRLTPEYSQLFGIDFGEAVPLDDEFRITHPEDRNLLRNAFNEALSGRAAMSLDARVFKGGTEERWYHFEARLVNWIAGGEKSGKAQRLAGVAVDITDRKLIELEKAEALAIRDEFFKMPSLLLTISDAEGRYIDLNAAWTETLGYSISELRGKNILDLIHPDDIEKTRLAIEHSGRKNPISEFINRYRTKSGSYRWLLWSSFPSGEGNYGFARDITALKEAEEALREQESRLRALSELAPQILWMANTKGEIYWFSRAMMDYTGLAGDALLGEAWLETRAPEDRNRVRQIYQDAMGAAGELEIEERIRDRAGNFHWFLTRMRAEKDADGKILRWYGSHTDIDMLKQAQVSSEVAKLAAEKASAAKSQFLANMSHEIRTPLGAMLGFAELMKDQSISSLDEEKYLEIVTRNGHQLSHIVNDILDLSKVEAGQMSVELRNVPVANLVHEVFGLLHMRAAEKNVGFRFKMDEGVREELVTDPTRLRQILMNLIGNALKFTHEGFIQVQIRGSQTGDKLSCLHFEITDTGIGIGVEEQQRLFEVFAQGDGSTTRLYGGTGIGLFLSRKLARSLGGDVKLLRSEPGRGSVFELIIKDNTDVKISGVDEVSAASPAEFVIATDDLPDVRGLRVLVAEDSSDNQELIRLFLEKSDVKFDIVANGLEAYEQALRAEYDVILMDIQMPVMDGYTATRRLRESGYRKPILAITAHAMREFVEKCLDAGCDDHIAKPLERKKLLQALSRYGTLSKSATPSSSSSSPSSGLSPEASL